MSYFIRHPDFISACFFLWRLVIGIEYQWSVECVTERAGDGTIAVDNGTSVAALNNFLSSVELSVISACDRGYSVLIDKKIPLSIAHDFTLNSRNHCYTFHLTR